MKNNDIYFCFRPRKAQQNNWELFVQACTEHNVKPAEILNTILVPITLALNRGPQEEFGPRVYDFNLGNLPI